MKNEITINDIKNNTFFWYTYISCFRGYDDVKEININEALEVLEIDHQELTAWENHFFSRSAGDEFIRYIGGKLNEQISFLIEFQESETIFFLNDLYIGNLGGHFEAWFFTWNELVAFQQFEYLFLLLLPMTGIEEQQADEARLLINNHLKTIPRFNNKAEYLANCIINGLKMNGQFFEQNETGILNNQNHSVRNIKKYPRYAEDVIKLNGILKELVEKA